jgi:3-dehydroquinate synthase
MKPARRAVPKPAHGDSAVAPPSPSHRIAVPLASGPSDVLVGSGLLAAAPELLAAEGLARPRAVVSNTTVGPLYGRRLAAGLGLAGGLELPDGEAHKRWTEVERVVDHWLTLGLTRRDLAVAVGGGVVSDLVGFAAAVYQRGIPWVAVPTTLLAMVDAAVGGKTGVNLAAGKNLVGAFWPPRLVVADVTTLATLPERELRAGLAEVVKTAWIGDHALLDRLPADPARADASDWVEVVARAVAVKARIVVADERESGERQALNLGHTLGHALEAATGYQRFRHGEAVAWGLLAVAELAARRGLIGQAARRRLSRAVAALGPLPAIDDLDPDALIAFIARDKKADLAGVAWVLPTDHGVALDQRLDGDELRRVVVELQAAGAPRLE